MLTLVSILWWNNWCRGGGFTSLIGAVWRWSIINNVNPLMGLTREAWNVESWQKCGSVVECGGATPRPWEEEEEASAWSTLSWPPLPRWHPTNMENKKPWRIRAFYEIILWCFCTILKPSNRPVLIRRWIKGREGKSSWKASFRRLLVRIDERKS